MSSLLAFLNGALTMASFVAGLLFLKFWRRTGDRLFVFFAAALWTLGVTWFALVFEGTTSETRHHVYAIRLLSFGLLLVGIADKNRRRRS